MSPAASSRWCPTPEQLMILEEMYRSGIRTPNAAQIQQITAHLAIYGRIEGKNVFYWFQNHKARDRQKLRKRLTKQLQQQQPYQPYYHANNQFRHHCFDHVSSASGSTMPFPHVSNYYGPPASFLPQGGGREETASKVVNYCNNSAWKIDDIPAQRMEIIENPKVGSTYCRDWMTMDVKPTSSCSNINPRPPLKTLELFPITSSNFKEETHKLL